MMTGTNIETAVFAVLSLKQVGFGFEADRPNQVVQMDDAPLGKALMSMPAVICTSVLVLIDVCSGIVSF